MVGLLEDTNQKMTLYFRKAGDQIYMIGKSRNDIHSSSFLHALNDVEYSPAPYFDLEEEYLLQAKLSACIEQGLLESAHDVAEGGLFIALAECGFHKTLGFSVSCQNESIRRDAYWFGESQSRVVVSIKNENLSAFQKAMEGFPFEKLG